jgi:hypothetical protein
MSDEGETYSDEYVEAKRREYLASSGRDSTRTAYRLTSAEGMRSGCTRWRMT